MSVRQDAPTMKQQQQQQQQSDERRTELRRLAQHATTTLPVSSSNRGGTSSRRLRSRPSRSAAPQPTLSWQTRGRGDGDAHRPAAMADAVREEDGRGSADAPLPPSLPLHRQLDQVRRVGGDTCRFTTALDSAVASPDPAFLAYDATLFTVQSASDVQLLSMQLDIVSSALGQNPAVSVYLHEGLYDSTVLQNPDLWQRLVDNVRVVRDPLSPSASSFIVPIQYSRSYSIRPGRIYSIYVVLTSGIAAHMQLLRSDSTVEPSLNQPFRQDEYLQLYTGVGLTFETPSHRSDPFSSALAGQLASLSSSSSSAFLGRFHYSTTQPCNDLRIKSNLYWEFAIDERGASTSSRKELTDALQSAVANAVSAVFVLSPDLIRYAKFEGLEQHGDVQARIEFASTEGTYLDYQCPSAIPECSIGIATVSYLHAVSLLPGELTYTFLEQRDTIVDSVEASMTTSFAPTLYIGNSMNTGKFVITMVGVPASARLNSLQRRYVEHITTKFLQKDASFDTTVDQRPAVLKSVITDEVPLTSAESNDNDDTQRRRATQTVFNQPFVTTMHSAGLRGSRPISPRLLQDTDNANALGTLQVGIDIVGTATPSDLRSIVLEAFEQNPDVVTHRLATDWLRPGEINELDSGQFFRDLSDTAIMLQPSDFGLSPPTLPPGSDGSDSGGGSGSGANAVRYISILGIVIGIIWLSVQFWRDYLRDFLRAHRILKPQKLDDAGTTALAASDEENETKQHRNAAGRSLPVIRRPSLDGNRSLDGSVSRPGRSTSNFNSASDHVSTRIRKPSSTGELDRFLSEHAGRTPMRGTRANRSAGSSADSDMSPSNRAGQRGRGIRSTRSMDDMTKYRRNRAGENGRGNLRPTKSMDFPPQAPRRPLSSRSHSLEPPKRRGVQRTKSFEPPRSNSRLPSEAPRNRAGKNGRGIRATKSMEVLPPRSARSTDGFEKRPSSEAHCNKIIQSARTLPTPSFSSASNRRKISTDHSSRSESSIDSDDSDMDSDDGSEFALNSNHVKTNTTAKVGKKQKPALSSPQVLKGPKEKNTTRNERRDGIKRKKTASAVVDVSRGEKKTDRIRKLSKHSPVRKTSSVGTDVKSKKVKSFDESNRGAGTATKKKKPPKRFKSIEGMPACLPSDHSNDGKKTSSKSKKDNLKKKDEPTIGSNSDKSSKAGSRKGTKKKHKSDVREASLLDESTGKKKRFKTPDKRKKNIKPPDADTTSTTIASSSSRHSKSSRASKSPKRHASKRVPSKASKIETAELERVSGGSKKGSDKDLSGKSSKGSFRSGGSRDSKSKTSFGSVKSKNFDPEFMSKEDMEEYLASPKFEKEKLTVIPLDVKEGGSVLKGMRNMKYLNRPTAEEESETTKTRMPPGRSKSTDSAEFRRKAPLKTSSMNAYGKHGKIRFARRPSQDSKSTFDGESKVTSSGHDSSIADESSSSGSSSGGSDESSVYAPPPSVRGITGRPNRQISTVRKKRPGRLP